MWTKEKQDAYNKKYQLKNKEKIKKMQADYYAKNRQARIDNARNWYLKNHDKALEKQRANMKTPKGRLSSIKSSARTRKIDFLITDDEAKEIMNNPCFYCGDSVPVGIDRIDSNLGYTLKNSAPCCSMCNYMKKDFNQSDFIAQCKKIASHI